MLPRVWNNLSRQRGWEGCADCCCSVLSPHCGEGAEGTTWLTSPLWTSPLPWGIQCLQSEGLWGKATNPWVFTLLAWIGLRPH